MIDDAVAASDIVLFTRPSCAYCQAAESELLAIGIAPRNSAGHSDEKRIELGSGPSMSVVQVERSDTFLHMVRSLKLPMRCSSRSRCLLSTHSAGRQTSILSSRPQLIVSRPFSLSPQTTSTPPTAISPIRPPYPVLPPVNQLPPGPCTSCCRLRDGHSLHGKVPPPPDPAAASHMESPTSR